MVFLRLTAITLLLSLHRLSPRNLAWAFLDPPSLLQSRKSQRSAVVMSSSEIHLPNWRTVNPDTPNSIPPFSHNNSKVIAAAPWSRSAYQSSLDLHTRLSSCNDPYLAPVLASALHDLEMAYRLYGPHCMVGSYNGGKDACVIFHLMRAVHAKHCRDMLEKHSDGDQLKEEFAITRPRVIYFQHPDEFPSVTTLLEQTVRKYDVEMLAFEEGTSFPSGLTYLVENNHPPGRNGQYQTQNEGVESHLPAHPLAFILGTRSEDPNAGSQGIYAPSSHYMPPFLRVNPILNWTYGHVWHFLRTFNLEYCSLYDEGYTSLGTVKDTVPCPALEKEDGGYFPAYMLRDWSLERAGRMNKKTKEEKDSRGDEEFDKSENQVTMSQTSSTVSLPETSKTIPSILDQNGILTNSTTDEPTILHSPTVALIVIGDELLKGLTSDANVLSASRALRSYNVSLARVSIISDDLQTIVEEIKRISKEVDVVITSGGVGPTHDDVTVRSVAKACGVDIEFDVEMARLLVEKMESGEMNASSSLDSDDLFATLSDGMRKMASIPAGSTLKYLSPDPKKDEWPVLQCNKIFILPGIPSYFQNKINQLAAYLSTPLTMAEFSPKDLTTVTHTYPRRLSSPPPSSDTYRVILSAEENSIVTELNAAVRANPHVTFGSYPLVDHPEYKTIVTLEGRFYNGGLTNSSERVLKKLSDSTTLVKDDCNDRQVTSANQLYFSKHEMDNHVRIALEDLKSRLPSGIIIKVDSKDHLSVNQT